MAFAALSRRFRLRASSNGRKRRADGTSAVELLAKSALATVRKAEDPKPPPRSKNRFRLWLKTFGLWTVQAWKREEEQPKIAIHQDRHAAALRCLIHLAPVSGVIALLCLNLSGTFVGTEVWSQTTTVLQFVAKLHEILIASSLAVALASYTHHHLTSDQGLPFGAAFATTQVFQLSYLVSPELLGAARALSCSRLFKLQLLPVLILVPLLISTVGPASAACMIPRVGPWYYSFGIFGFSKTRGEFFPVDLDLDSSAVASWNATGMDSFVRFTPIFGTSSPSLNKNTSILWPTKNVSTPMTLYIQTEGPFNETDDAVYRATTSIQNIALATTFGASGQPWIIEDSMDAFSSVTCLVENQVIWEASNDESRPPSTLLFNTADGAIAAQLDVYDMVDILNIQSSLGTLSPNVSGVLGETVRFFDLPGTNATGIVYFTADTDLKGNAFITLHPCTATLGWYPADLHNTGQVIQSRSLPDLQKPNHQVRPTYIKIASLRTMPLLPSSTISDGLRLLLNDWMIPSLAPFAISVMLTITLSTASGTVPSSGVAICNAKTGYCGDFRSKFKQISFRYGYGYGVEITSVRISLAILLLYCLIALSHTAFTIYTGRTSTAWDSIAEFVALAMGSRKPAELRNTSAGIDRAQVFEHRVRIAATVGDGMSWSSGEGHEGAFEPVGKHLELVFPSTEGAVLSKVRPNTEYAESAI